MPTNIKPAHMETASPQSVATRARGIVYQPALDGLRGLALLAIVVYHSGAGWAPGAFLSVSTFFTLSGFLITALLLRERELSGTISLRRFWTRRLRRLMPAALMAILLITIASVFLADAAQIDRLLGDALSSLAYVANWHFILAGDSYQAIFSSPSPFTHFWTLAIEEQFYVLLPILVAVLLLRGAGARHRLAVAVFGTLILASLVWSNFLLSSGSRLDRLYFGTDTRLPELLAGGLLAFWWIGRASPSGRAGLRIRLLSSSALVVVVVLWVMANREHHFWYRGGLFLYSLLTVAIIVGAVQRRGPVRRALSFRPLIWVGTLSYAAYLIHWPVLVWLRQYTDLEPWQRLFIGLVVTLAAASASQRFIERPVRASTWSPRRTFQLAATSGGAVAVLVLLVSISVAPAAPVIDFEAAAARQASMTKLLAAREKKLDTTEADKAVIPALRVATFGDSTSFMTGFGLAEWGFAHPQAWYPSGGASGIGCGLLTNVMRRTKGELATDPDDCAGWLQKWAADADAHRPQVAVVQLGPWEVVDQQIDRTGPFHSILTDPRLADTIRSNLDVAVNLLRDRSDLVILLLSPDIEMGRSDGRSPSPPFAESDPARMERFRQMLRDADEKYDDVKVIDLAGWLAAHSDDAVLRPDGVHFSTVTGRTVADWLAPQVLAVAQGVVEPVTGSVGD